jgi:preprotein translocase subunit SecA
MLNTLLAKVFGTSNERAVKKLLPVLAQINAHEAALTQLTDAQLTAKTAEFKARIAAALEGITDADEIAAAEKQALNDILPEAFAVVREAGKRVVGMRHFDVQMIGGMVLHSGKISEMKTGEGKTLVATLPCYLNALAGHGVHVVTVNDYLAKRDAEWMGKIYGFLGLSVGVIVHDLSDEQRREAYASDITYGTNNEFGFDYLRDNMKFELAEQVQRSHYFCIVDEVDSILIDEARTPLIISGPTDKTTDKYAIANKIIPQLEEGEMIENFEAQAKTWTGDYVVDEKARAITVTDEGWLRIEKLLGIGNIAEPENWDMKHHIEVAIKAHTLYKRDVEYVNKDGEIIIVDEFTGRLMPGRRWSDGLHQAVEAKEGVAIRKEDQTLATITFQNYFRLYKKLAGMTGTAETEAAEFDKIYKLEIVVIPTNRQMLRIENSDVIYRTLREKYVAVADEIERLHAAKQPVLVGTTSIEKSELLSDILQKKGVRHVVLNAKFHEKEAEIVAQAGRLGMVTIATNMAGRGTDILLGGNSEFMAKQDLVKNDKASGARAISAAEGAISPVAPAGFVRFMYQSQEFEVTQQQWDDAIAKHSAATKSEHDQVIEAGGLHILGTERHESRRVDNQLRGRAGRQGDPGSSRFFLSLEDDLMRIFAGERMKSLLLTLGMEEGVPIEGRMISNRIEAAQKQVESQNFESRKHVLEYDDVMNKQREAVYGLRRQLMEGTDQKLLIADDYVSTILSNILDEFAPVKAHPEQWNIEQIKAQVFELFGLQLDDTLLAGQTSRHELGETIFTALQARYDLKEKILGETQLRYHERIVMLSVLDGLWKEHLLNMDHLKEGIGLRGYAQQDPLVAYKKESFEMFEQMMLAFQEQTARHLFRMQILAPDGSPIETLEELARLQARSQAPVAEQQQLPLGNLSQATKYSSPSSDDLGAPGPDLRTRDGSPQSRAPATTIDKLEREFARTKQRDLAAAQQAGGTAVATQRRTANEVGRNDPCPCGSGKKYKKCHGAAT